MDPLNPVDLQSPGQQTGSMSKLGVQARLHQLGVRLRDLRLTAQPKLSLDYASMSIDENRYWLMRIEKGKQPPTEDQLIRLCDLYGADEATQRQLLSLLSGFSRTGIWDKHAEAFRSNFPFFEANAAGIRTFENYVIPGLLQIEGYIWSLMKTFYVNDFERQSEKVQARTSRQTLLEQLDGPTLHAIVDESVFRRRVGSRAIMRNQLNHLLDLQDRVIIQMLPLRVGAHPGMDGPFVLLHFEDGLYTDKVFREDRFGSTYEEGTAGVELAEGVFAKLTSLAITPEETHRLIRSIMKEEFS